MVVNLDIHPTSRINFEDFSTITAQGERTCGEIEPHRFA